MLRLWKQSDEYGFLRDAQSQTLQQSLKALDRAFMDGFDRTQPNKRMPRFKRKGSHDAFRFPQSVRVSGRQVFLPKIGWVKMRLSREVDGVIKNATVSRRGDHWFVSIQTEIDVPEPVHPATGSTGVDRGVVNLATLSDGTAYSGGKSLSRRSRKLAREQRLLSRKVRFSNNWKKQRDRIARLHIQITDARMDALHKATTTINKNHALVCLEKLRVNNMSASARGSVDYPGSRVRQKAGLNRSILNAGWGAFARMLEYKQAWRGGLVEYVNPAYTSQICSGCGHISPDNRRLQAVFVCTGCGYTDNADVNAAKNILAAGIAVLRRGTSRKPVEGKGVGLPVKQEPEVAAMQPLPVVA